MGRSESLATAIQSVGDGASVYLGGAMLSRKPMAAVRAIAAAGRRDLHLLSFAGSLDVDLLVGTGAAASVAAAHVSLGPHGPAPCWARAVRDGLLSDREQTEWTLIGGLRAAAMGVPFLPARAGIGSQVVEELAPRHVRDPYDGDEYLAIPPVVPDVAVLHAWRATPRGDVQLPWPPDPLWDVDVVAARAARTVVVTVEEVVGEAVVAGESHLTRLFGFEVDLVVEAPGGSWPTACRPLHDVDDEALAAYAASGGDSALVRPAGAP